MSSSLRAALLALVLVTGAATASAEGNSQGPVGSAFVATERITLLPPFKFLPSTPGQDPATIVLDVTGSICVWGGPSRFTVPEAVLSRHGLTRETLARLVIVYGGCRSAKACFLADPRYVVEEETTHGPDGSVASAIPPLPNSLPYKVLQWTEERAAPDRTVGVEEVVGDLGYRGLCRFCRVLLEKEGPFPEVAAGYLAATEGDAPPPSWRMLYIMKKEGRRAFHDAPVGAYPDPISQGGDPLAERITKSLHGKLIPQSKWLEEEQEMDRNEPLSKRVRMERVTVRVDNHIPMDDPKLFHYSVIPEDATGTLPIHGDGYDLDFAFDCFAEPDGRFWVVPPMESGRMFEVFNIVAALDTNTDNRPDLLIVEWAQGEGFGSAILLQDHDGLFLVASGGGYYCP